jgi:hypothetical protein
MASASLPKPGTQYGPCEHECQHIDCAETRKMSETQCHVCGTPIGYDKQFYRRGLTLSHAPCLEDSIYAIR